MRKGIHKKVLAFILAATLAVSVSIPVLATEVESVSEADSSSVVVSSEADTSSAGTSSSEAGSSSADTSSSEADTSSAGTSSGSASASSSSVSSSSSASSSTSASSSSASSSASSSSEINSDSSSTPVENSVITVDVSTATMPFRIEAGDTNSYVFTGSYVASNSSAKALINNTDGIIVETGYNGTVTLDNLTIDVSTQYSKVALLVEGSADQSLYPLANNVKIVLKGDNTLASGSSRAGLEVLAGAQITIEADATDPNASLTAKSGGTNSTGGGAGIGAGQNTVGGNIVIKSGKITAVAGYHGAGIGGGWYEFYDATIVIYGGDVTSIGGYHGAGIGGGCKNTYYGTGYDSSHDYTGTILVLPPAKINASTPSSAPELVGYMGTVVYVGDPSAPLVTVETSEKTVNADIFMDLTQVEGVNKALQQTGIDTTTEITPGRIKLGTTGGDGQVALRMKLSTQKPVRFYTEVLAQNGTAFFAENAVIDADKHVVLNPGETPNSTPTTPSSVVADKYTVTYLTYDLKEISTASISVGDVVPLIGAPAVGGHTFAAWVLDGTTTQWNANTAMPSRNITLVATYNKNVATTSTSAKTTGAPKTGDTTNVGLWMSLAGAATLSLAGVAVCFKRFKANQE